MALNGKVPEGDDQAWKSEVEKELKALRKELEKANSEIAYLRQLRG